jgi:death-on-curing protein
MSEPRWLSVAVVTAIHADQVREHGGAPGIRDSGLLESALERPRNEYHYGETRDLASLAASYGFGLAMNHAFTDGNKRVAFQAMAVFMLLNGMTFTASEEDVVRTIIALAASELEQKDLEAWVRVNTATL